MLDDDSASAAACCGSSLGVDEADRLLYSSVAASSDPSSSVLPDVSVCGLESVTVADEGDCEPARLKLLLSLKLDAKSSSPRELVGCESDCGEGVDEDHSEASGAKFVGDACQSKVDDSG